MTRNDNIILFNIISLIVFDNAGMEVSIVKNNKRYDQFL